MLILKTPFIFPVRGFRTIAALCLILILQNERWRQNITEIIAYKGMFLSTYVGYSGNTQSSHEQSAVYMQL